MKFDGQLLPEQQRVSDVGAEGGLDASARVVSTHDHDVIRQWAEKRHAEPATGEATVSGPAKVNVNDGGAGIRFNFPGTGLFRPIEWDEWFGNFDRNECVFVFERDEPGAPLSHRYRIVRAAEWQGQLK
jgi:hypothetical protein